MLGRVQLFFDGATRHETPNDDGRCYLADAVDAPKRLPLHGQRLLDGSRVEWMHQDEVPVREGRVRSYVG